MKKELFRKIFSSHTLEDSLHHIFEFLKEKWGIESIGIQLLNEEKSALVFYKQIGIPIHPEAQKIIQTPIPLNQENSSISLLVFQKQKTIYANTAMINNKEKMSKIDRETIEALNIKENLLIPILFEKKSIGVFHCTGINRNLNLQKKDIQEIQDFIYFISPHLQMVRQREELEKTKTEQELLIRLIKKINSTIDLDQLLDYLGEEIKKNNFFDGYFITILDEEKKNLIIEKIDLSEKFKNMEAVLLKKKLPLEKSVNDFFETIYSNMNTVINKNNIKAFSIYTQRNFELWECENAIYLPLCGDFEKLEKENSIGTIFLFTHKRQITEKEIQKTQRIIEIFYKQIENSIFYSQLKEKKEEILTASEKNKKVLELAQTVNNLTSLKEIYSTILREILPLFGFDYAMIFMKKNNNLSFVTAHVQDPKYLPIVKEAEKYYIQVEGYRLDPTDGACSNGFLRNVYFYFNDVQTILHLPMSPKDRQGLTILKTPRTLLLMPIRKGNQPIGSIHLYTFAKPLNLTEKDLSIIEALFSFIGSAIENAKLYSLVEEQKNKLEEQNIIIKNKNYQLLQELKLAEKIQKQLIPNMFPTIANTRFAALYKPMENIGGDFYDFIQGNDKNWVGIFISDVSGHGVPAALITSMLKTLLETAGEEKLKPDQLFHYINQKLIGQISGNFLTAFYGIYNSQEQIFKYSRASHNYPFLIRKKEIIPLSCKGNIIGVMEDATFEEKEIQLQKGDKILFYTDGLTEATNLQGEEFEELLPDLLLKNYQNPIHQVIDNIYHELLKFREDYRFEDDVCLLGMEIL